jgi:DNA-binding NtrC family response regulator
VEHFPDQVDLAIIDHTLEDRKGADVGTELTALQPRIRTLLISGALEDEVTSTLASRDPIPSFLQKPFSREALLDKIRQMLADRSAGSAGTH